MAAVAFAAVLALVYPQSSSSTAAQIASWATSHKLLAAVGLPLAATNVFGSWWFLLVAALLFVSGSLCLVEQIEKAIHLTRKKGFALTARMAKPGKRNRVASTSLEPQVALDAVADSLKTAGLGVRKGRRGEDPALLGVGRGWTEWGTVLFHGSLLLMLVSVVLVSLTHARGQFRLNEAGGFIDGPGAYGAYSRGALGPSSLGGWSLELRAFNPRYRRGAFEAGPASTVVVRTASGEKISRLLTRGEYFDVGGTNVFQSGAWGLAPVIGVTHPNGRKQTGAVLMDLPEFGTKPVAVFDAGQGVSVRVTMLDVTDSTRRKPELGVEVSRGATKILSRNLVFGGSASKNGYSVSYGDIRYWTELGAISSPWLAAANLAFWLLVAGASIMYLWPATYAWALVRSETDGNVVYLGGRKEKFSSDFLNLVERAKMDLWRAEKTE